VYPFGRFYHTDHRDPVDETPATCTTKTEDFNRSDPETNKVSIPKPERSGLLLWLADWVRSRYLVRISTLQVVSCGQSASFSTLQQPFLGRRSQDRLASSLSRSPGWANGSNVGGCLAHCLSCGQDQELAKFRFACRVSRDRPLRVPSSPRVPSGLIRVANAGSVADWRAVSNPFQQSPF
jgi:hypothetical protein